MRQGRELEVLVSLIEKALGDSPVTVQSPEYVVGRSGQRREIDVSIRGTVGSAEVFVAVECRDRSEVQGVGWIDEVRGKHDDIGASKTIVVCSSSFSEPAIKTAETYGIDLRTLDEISGPEILAWVHPSLTHVNMTYRRVDFVACTSDLDPATDVSEIAGSPPTIDLTTPVFRFKRDRNLVSPWELWRSLPTHELYEPPTGTDRRLVNVNAESDPANPLQVQIGGDWHDLIRVRFQAWVWLEHVQIPIRQFRYAGTDGASFGEGFDIEVEGPAGPGRMALTLTETPEGETVLNAGYRPYSEQDSEPEPPIDFAGTPQADG